MEISTRCISHEKPQNETPHKSAAGKPPGSLLSAMTSLYPNPHLAFPALPRPEAARVARVRRFCACSEIGSMVFFPHMIQTIEAIIDERGAVRLLVPLHLDRRHRALVTILADEPSEAHETALLSEASLAEDWNRPEEDAAWSHLQQVP